jgi:hypothetical protein
MFGSRLIFGSHFPFRVAQLRDARARGWKLALERPGMVSPGVVPALVAGAGDQATLASPRPAMCRRFLR